MADLRRFADRIRALGERVERNATIVTRKVALAVDAAVVIATPVDTGRARSNWQVSIGFPASSERSAYQEGKLGSTAGANSQAAIDQGKQVIASYTNGQTIYITNNLRYIGKLNEGWSAQAPAGYVENAVLVGIAAVKSAGSLLGGATFGN